MLSLGTSIVFNIHKRFCEMFADDQKQYSVLSKLICFVVAVLSSMEMELERRPSINTGLSFDNCCTVYT